MSNFGLTAVSLMKIRFSGPIFHLWRCNEKLLLKLQIKMQFNWKVLPYIWFMRVYCCASNCYWTSNKLAMYAVVSFAVSLQFRYFAHERWLRSIIGQATPLIALIQLPFIQWSRWYIYHAELTISNFTFTLESGLRKTWLSNC